VSFLPIPVARGVVEAASMTPTTTSTATVSLWARIRLGLADTLRAQEALWESLQRIEPDPDPHLHWEPTLSGWRLYGYRSPPG
jgi:hypothetical protein